MPRGYVAHIEGNVTFSSPEADDPKQDLIETPRSVDAAAPFPSAG